MNIPPYRGILMDFDAISIFIQSVCACACVCLRERERERGYNEMREKKCFHHIQRERTGVVVVLSWFPGPFFRAVFPDHRAPTFLPWPFDIKRRKPLSSYRVKRLFSNLLADIGFITFPRLSLSLQLSYPCCSIRCFPSDVSCAFHSSSLSPCPYCHGKTNHRPFCSTA